MDRIDDLEERLAPYGRSGAESLRRLDERTAPTNSGADDGDEMDVLDLRLGTVDDRPLAAVIDLSKYRAERSAELELADADLSDYEPTDSEPEDSQPELFDS